MQIYIILGCCFWPTGMSVGTRVYKTSKKEFWENRRGINSWRDYTIEIMILMKSIKPSHEHKILKTVVASNEHIMKPLKHACIWNTEYFYEFHKNARSDLSKLPVLAQRF